MKVIHLHPSTYAYELLSFLAIVGEFPRKSLYLLGNERMLKRVVNKGKDIQEVSIPSGKKYTVRLFVENGHGGLRSIRMHRSALNVLEDLSDKAAQYYMQTYKHNFMPQKVPRRHRVAEGMAMISRAGIESLPYSLPPLRTTSNNSVVRHPSFYSARYIKGIDELGINKTAYTRTIGALFAHDKAYVVYNTSNTDMKWVPMGEFKARQMVEEIARHNAGIYGVNSAIVFGNSFDAAIRIMIQPRKNKTKNQRLDTVFDNILFVPLSNDGIRMLSIIAKRDWQQTVTDALFPKHMQLLRPINLECDAILNKKHILSLLDGNIARLQRFKETVSAAKDTAENYEVICYDFMSNAIEEYLEGLAIVRSISIDKIEELFGGV